MEAHLIKGLGHFLVFKIIMRMCDRDFERDLVR